MKSALLSAAFVAMVISPIAAQSNENNRSGGVGHEARERELAFQLAPIKTAGHLQQYLARSLNRDSPLRFLSPGARQRFIQSLVFTDKGLASFDYRDLRVELSATQAYQLLSLFGAQRSTRAIPGLQATTATDATIMWNGGDGVIGDYPDYWCESKATCRPSTGAICIGGNC